MLDAEAKGVIKRNGGGIAHRDFQIYGLCAECLGVLKSGLAKLTGKSFPAVGLIHCNGE